MFAIFVVITVIAVYFIELVFCLPWLWLARAAGITVRETWIGAGPSIARFRIGSIAAQVRLLPFGSGCRFKSHEEVACEESAGANGIQPFAEGGKSAKSHGEFLIDGETREPCLPSDSFFAANACTRAGITLSAPVTVLVLGLLLLALPIGRGQALKVVHPEHNEIRFTAIPNGLAFEQRPTTWEDQVQLVELTSLGFLSRLLAFQSLDGWGGFIGFVATSAEVGTTSLWGWISCLGSVALGMGLMTLVPIPTTAGGAAAFHLFEWFAGKRVSTRTFNLLSFVGLAINCVFWIRVVWLDIWWCWYQLQ